MAYALNSLEARKLAGTWIHIVLALHKAMKSVFIIIFSQEMHLLERKVSLYVFLFSVNNRKDYEK